MIGFEITALLIILKAWYDFELIQDGKIPSHKLEFSLYILVCACTALILHGWAVSTILNWIAYIALYGTFDYLLNWMRGKDWWYLGDNWFDRILHGYKWRWYRFAIKLFIIIFTIILTQIIK